MTHSGSSVHFVPAAQDETGLGIVHPVERQTEKQRRRDRQSHRLETAKSSFNQTEILLFRQDQGVREKQALMPRDSG